MASAIILAGGKGTRLRSVVANLPKPMAPIRGKPFLAYQMQYWIEQGINRFILSVGYRYEDVKSYFGHEFEGIPIEYAIEKKPLGTGGGFLLARKFCRDEIGFLLLNGDTYFPVSLDELKEFSIKNQADFVFSVFSSPDSERYMGMEVASDGRIMALKCDASQINSFVNGGVYWVNNKKFDSFVIDPVQHFSLESDIFPSLLAQGKRLFALEVKKNFIDIGIPADYSRASFALPQLKV